MQKPDASLVAGFSAWKNNFGRNVIKGQKGIKIIAPSPYKVKQEMKKIDPHTQQPIIGKDGKPVTEEKEITIPAYKVVSVFDVSQTEGRELPDIAVNELTGDVERYRDFFAALEKTSPVPIGFEQIPGSSHGYYHLEDKRIAIDEGMSEIQTLKTAIHEIAHAKLHDIDLNAPENEQQPHIDRRTREVEAESVAYTVCQHYGLDTSDYSFGYVAGWSSGRELSELKSSLETIRSAAAEIINSIDETLAELSKAQDKEQTAGQEQPDKEENAAPEQPKQEASAQEKAAFIPETVYRVRRNPYSDRKENAYLLQAYVTQENGRAKMGAVLFTGTPQKCRELMGQLKSGELTEGQVKELYAKAQETAKTAEQDKGTFSIYQLKHGDETRDLRFEPYDRLQATGNVVDKANYELVYSAELTPGTSLEDIYTRFNIDHPKDFKGHSLSVSDVVVLHQNGQDAAHYVDSFGYKNVPEFLQEQKQLTPDELETGETIKTPRGTFYVTDMSREQMEAAGYGFHHQSDDGKYLVMGMAISTRQVKNKRDSNGVLTGRPGTVYDVNIKYTAPNGEKKTYSKKGFPTKKEATQHEAEMKAKLHNPGQIASIASQRKQTVASYLNEWVESYARVNLRPSTYDGYKKTIANYINPYIGGVALNQLTPAMVDKMFQQIIDKGLKPSTAAGAKRVLSVALSHARKYRYIETNAAKDTLTKFGKSDKTPDPYTPEQVKALMQRVEGTVWEMPVILGGLYGMRRSEILGLRWRNVDLENNTFDVSEQLPFKVPSKTKVIEEMAPPKSNGRKLPITELARPFFLKQFAMQEAQREQAEKDGKPYYDNDLVVAKPDGSPISASWVSSQFGKLLEDLDMPHIRFHDLRHTAATNMHQLTGDFYTVGEVLGHTLAGIGVSLGLSMNFEAVTARYVDVRHERKKEVLDAYHGAVKQSDPAKAEKAEPKKAKSAAKKKSSDLEL